MTSQDIVSIIHFIAFGIYFGFAMLVLFQDLKEKVNQLFGSILILLAFWAYTFSIANSAVDYETALLWREVGSIGWGLVFSFVLRLLLYMVKDNGNKLIKHLNSMLGRVLIYGLGGVNVLFYLIWKEIADKQFKLVWSEYGWMSVGAGTIISNYFNIYLLIILGLSLWTSFIWLKQLKETKGIKQSYAVIISFFAAAFIGVAIDVIIVNVLGFELVQVSVLVGVIPVVTIFLTSNHFNFASGAIIAEESKGFHLVPQGSRRDIAFYMAAMVYIGSLGSFVFLYFIYNESLFIANVYSSGLLLMAGFLYVIPLFKLSDKRKDFWILIVLAIFIPYVLLHYAGVDAAVTIWVVPVFLILLSVVFSSQMATYFISGVTVITLTVIGIFYPVTEKTLYIEEHLLRIGIILVFTWLALYVRKLYIRRLRENEQQYRIQKMVADISTEILSINEKDSTNRLDGVFKKIGVTAEVDLIYVMNIENLSKEIIYLQAWSAETNTKNIRKFPKVMDSFLKVIDSEKSLLIQKVAGIPNEYKLVRDMLEGLDIYSTIMYPIVVKDQLSGVFGMAYTNTKKSFDSHDAEIYQTTANILSDAYQKARAEKEIHELAYYDQLTGLPNRSSLYEYLEEELAQMVIHQQRLAVLFMDLDSFKWVNDSIGHWGGDLLLEAVAARINECLTGRDKAFRFSGDEFVFVHIIENEISGLNLLVNRLLNKLKEPYVIEDVVNEVTVSIGVAIFPEDGNDYHELLRNADLAMYEAKIDGKNQAKYCTNEFKSKLYDKHQMIMKLRKAMENEELEVYYQPQVDGISKEIIGYEALLRWKNPELGHVPPGVFIKLAEQTGLIAPIGEWVLRNVCQQYKKWEGSPLAKLPVGVNLSSYQLRDPNLYQSIKRIIDDTGMNPQLLEFEVTESVALEDFGKSIRLLEDFRKIGIKIAIDDFGTEYSSLNRLKELPVDRVKIAMDFVHGIHEDPKDEAVVNVIIYLAKRMGLRVIAEGVEDEFQLDYLIHEGCREIQGYYFYKPMDARALKGLFPSKE